MKILFAAPDRDLLECYKKLLEADFGEIVTAFDGTQIFSLLSAEKFDLVILDRDIPRVEHKKILARIREANTPVVVLTDTPAGVRRLTDEPLPSAYLPYPFDAEGIASVIRDTLQKASSGVHLDAYGLEIDVPGFRITNGPQLTAGEIDILQTLIKDGSVTTGDGACIGALNVKFALAGSKTRIKYRTKKGFETVNEDE